MAKITPEIQRVYGLAARLVPDDIQAKISQEEFVDRLAYGRDLVRKQQAATAPIERRELAERARAVMRARPREITERAVAELVTKSAGISDGASAGAVQAARRLLEEDPPAPRRKARKPVTKASGGDAENDKVPMLAVYDRNGNITGVVDPAALIRVSDDPATVAKALRARPRR